MSYKQVGTSRNWGVWQKNGQPDFIGNMKLSIHKSVPDVSPDLVKEGLEEAIGEYMLDSLKEHESEITSGPQPTPPPTPIPLTATEKTAALRTIGFTETNVGYLKTQVARNLVIAKKVEGLSASLSDVKKEVIADPPSRPLGLARYQRRH